MAFKSVEPVTWKHEKEGDSITGFLVEKEETAGQFDSPLYKLDCANGKFLVWGNKVMKDRMSFVNIGQVIRVTFKGKKKGENKREYNDYLVEVDDGEKEQEQFTPKVENVTPQGSNQSYSPTYNR